MATRTRTLVDLDKLYPNPWQPRRYMVPDRIEEMAASIEQITLLQVPMARPHNREGEYELAFAHQRVESCKLIAAKGREVNGWPVGWIEIDVADLTDQQMAIIALTENERRSDVPPLDLARAHRRAIDETGLTVGELSEQLGVARPTLQNSLRVLTLPESVLEVVEGGEMSMSVAREFLPLRCEREDHSELMNSVIEECEGEFTRRRVRSEIGYVTRSIGGWMDLDSDGLIDTDAFRAEHHDSLHTVPVYRDDTVTRVRTCNTEAWQEWRERARQELAEVRRLEQEAGETDAPDDRPDPRLAAALAEDPVWQGIALLRTDPGRDLPDIPREWEALGSRARFWDGASFGKRIAHYEGATEYGLKWTSMPGENSDLPPWFADLDECRECTIGAAWGNWFGKTELVCTNREHFLEKLFQGEAAYQARLQEARDLHDAEMIERYERLVEELMSMSPEFPRLMLRAMTDADTRLIWRHPMGVYHHMWSDESPITERVRSLLEAPFRDHNYHQVLGPREVVREKIAALPHEQAEELLALLVVMRDMEGWTATPQQLAESSPGNIPAPGMSELLAYLDEADLETIPEGLPIVDLYVCWDCGNHHVPVEPDIGVSTLFHLDCGAKMEFSGQLVGYDPDTGRISRTWDETPALRETAGERQAEIPEDAYELVGAS